MNGSKADDGLVKFVFEGSHLVEHGTGAVAEEDDFAGVAAVTEDRPFGTDAASAWGSEHRHGPGAIAFAASGVISMPASDARAFAEAGHGSGADDLSIIPAASTGCRHIDGRAFLIGPSFFAALGGVFILQSLAKRIAADPDIRHATRRAVIHHVGIGDDGLFLMRLLSDHRSNAPHEQAKDQDARMNGKGGHKGQNVLHPRLLKKAKGRAHRLLVFLALFNRRGDDLRARWKCARLAGNGRHSGRTSGFAR